MAGDWWVRQRNRLLASPRFQDFATRFPLTRPIARWHAARLFDLVAGFTYSQTLLAFVQLGLLENLRSDFRSIDELAEVCDLPRSAMTRLIDAAAALGLAQRVGGSRVTLGPAGAALAGNPGAVAMIAHHPRLYADLANPVALLRGHAGTGAIAGFWDYDPHGVAEGATSYSQLMGESQPPVAAQILGAYDFTRYRRLLDVGGGEGAFLAAAAARYPSLELGLFDLPAVGARAVARLGDRATIHHGDFLSDPLPGGYDLLTLVRVLHDHDDAAALAILETTRAAVMPGGALLIGEPMAVPGSADRMAHGYFGFYLLAMGRGRARTPSEIGTLLKQAGFARWKHHRTTMPLTASVIVAHP